MAAQGSLLVALPDELVHVIAYGTRVLDARDIVALAASCRAMRRVLLGDPLSAAAAHATAGLVACVRHRLWAGARRALATRALHAPPVVPDLVLAVLDNGEPESPAWAALVCALAAAGASAGPCRVRPQLERLTLLGTMPMAALVLSYGVLALGRQLAASSGQAVRNACLVVACARGDAELVAELRSGADGGPPASVSAYEQGALRAASMCGHTHIVATLLADADVDPTEKGSMAMRLAALGGHGTVVALLVQDGRADPGVHNNYPVTVASGKGCSEAVAALIADPRVDPSVRSNRALRSAARYGHASVVALLLQHPSVDPSAYNCDAYRAAVEAGHDDVAHLLQQAGASATGAVLCGAAGAVRRVSLATREATGAAAGKAEGGRARRTSPAGTAFADLDFNHLPVGGPAEHAAAAVAASEASFTVRSAGLGSLLQVSVAAGGHVLAAPGSVVAHSPEASAALRMTTTEQGVGAAVSRVLAGAPLVVSGIAAAPDAPADALVAPAALSDIALLELDGFARYCMAPGAFLASTEGVRLGPWTGLARAGRVRLAHASGRGLVAVAGQGGLVSLKLAPGESYVVRASRLVAWDDRIALRRQVTPDDDETAAALGGGDDDAPPSWQAKAMAMVRRTISGVRDIGWVRVQGEGEVVLSSRAEPRFGWAFSRSPQAAAMPLPASESSTASSAAAPVASATASGDGAAEAAEEKPKTRFGGVLGKKADAAAGGPPSE
ncbi:uncharacterized protein AMSG_12319 [Thecamonas trahens ATCC 50062]|uniref:Uncharacterized protein n=1 Tax=Thecamonas trahens ATCC 50062 TaxID=461836 RepID=A0A0L0DQ26_THETB|nr:hypothetical protein AMSG_12319 [Thecamonas trahens ATCC 50062]KNC54370.1 hypothetical protein AMSG_12319 [Thecamonas trahens ATCC 50062]|eukprot:XP_013753736.1 hypothetical protein AMSG_12319 [Thecamonas trahens ATCC 50062]